MSFLDSDPGACLFQERPKPEKVGNGHEHPGLTLRRIMNVPDGHSHDRHAIDQLFQLPAPQFDQNITAQMTDKR
ncbi:Uncharacterised protein [Mycobacterium tuberculosis]|nr:Uncharacterised protein [Mycobacterium tuberculosis]